MALGLEAAVAAPALLRVLPDTVVVADREGRIAYVNPAVEVLLGHRPETLLGQSLTVLMPERLRSGHGAGFSRYRETGEGKLVGETWQVDPKLAVAAGDHWRVTGRVGGNDDVGSSPERMIGRQGLDLEDVERRAGDQSGPQSRDQVGKHHEGTSSDVDQIA